jgi:replicative DNA helicase
MAPNVADVEIRLISKILNTRSLKVALKENVTQNFFHGDNKQIYAYIVDYFRNYGEVPHKKIVRNRFPQITIVPTKIEPIRAIIDELREREQYNLLRKTLQDASEALPNSVDIAFRSLVKAVSTINTEIRVSQDSDWVKRAKDRWAEFEEREKKQVFGIPTRWKGLDKLMLGFQDYHLVTVAGRPGIGKSWWVALNAYKAWRNGFNVLVVTKEMAVQEIERRLDALHAKIPYDDMRQANLKDPETRVQLKKKMKRLINKPVDSNTIYVSGEELSDGGVLSLAAKIEEYNPDILFVDGVYLLTDDRGGRSKVEQLYNITRDMKKLTKKFKIPVIQTCQMGRGAYGGKGGDDRLAKLQWSDSFSQDSDEVIEIFRRADLPGIMIHNLAKQREGMSGEIRTQWDFTTMIFDELMPDETGQEVIPSSKSNADMDAEIERDEAMKLEKEFKEAHDGQNS